MPLESYEYFGVYHRYQCSHIPIDWGSHRVQMSYLCSYYIYYCMYIKLTW